jgi:hypothetical protein
LGLWKPSVLTLLLPSSLEDLPRFFADEALQRESRMLSCIALAPPTVWLSPLFIGSALKTSEKPVG